MAIANSDGSIILSTKVDTSGMEQGTKSLKSQAAKLAAEYRKAGMSQSEAFKKAWSEIERTRKETDSATKSTENFGKQSQKSGKQAKGAFDGLKATLQSVAGYLALAFSVTKIIQFSNEAGQLATQTEASVQRLVDIYGSASDSVGDFIDANARALGMSKAAAASFSSVYGNLFSVWADQETNAQLTNEYLRMTAVVASKTGRTVEDVQERVRSGLLGNTEAIEDLGVFVNVKTIEMTDAFQRMANGKSWEQLDAYTQQQIRSMAILEQATAKYGDEVADTSATIRNRYKAAYEDFKNSWGVIVNQVLLPVLQVLTEIFNIATAGLNAFSGRSEKIIEDSQIQEETTNKTAENIEEQADAQKDLNKEMKKTLAGFDDIQILSAQTADNTSGGGLDSIPQGIGGYLGGNDPDGSAYVEEINETLAVIMQTVSISMIAIGLILLFTGNIGWGIGTIIFGAGLEGVTIEAITETDPSTTIISSILTLQGVAIGASIALGCMMIFMGSKGLGIGLIAYGAIQLDITIYEIGKFETNDIEKTITTIEGIAAGAMLAIGFFLLYFKANMPLAISLIAGGAFLLVDEILQIVEGGVSPEISAWIQGIQLLLKGAALVIGIILLATKANVPLGVGLVAAGAASLAKEVVVNWDAIAEMFTNEKTSRWIAVAGIVAIVLGIILCYAHRWKIGAGLIALGASTLAAEVVLNWDAIKKLFTNNKTAKWIAIGGIVAIALGILLCFAHQWGWGIGLIAMGAATVATETAVNWDAIKEQLTNKKIARWISLGGTVLVVLGILLCFVNLPLGISLIAAGAASLVINAVLNWDAIVQNIRNFVFENSELIGLISGGLLILGIILCASGVNLPLGIALIAAGAASLVTVTALNWDSIVDWVKGAWNAVKDFWNKNIAPVFTFEWWSNLFSQVWEGIKSAFDGMVKWFRDIFTQAWQAVVKVFSPLGDVFVNIKDGIVETFKEVVNGLIDGINTVISLPFEGLNETLDKIQNIKVLGVAPFEGLDWRISIPEIPKLAQGTVVPPNKEFMAILGDNTREHEVVSPLSTIQEAVSAVVNSQNEETQYILREILEAILGIQIGDDVIGKAANRYNRNQTIIHGG